MNDLFLAYDIETLKNESMYERAVDAYNMAMERLDTYLESVTEADDTANDFYATEAGKFLDTVKTFFEKLLENIKKLVKTVIEGVKTKIAQHKVNQKLKEMREQLSVLHFKGEKVSVFDSMKYAAAMTKYTNAVVAETRKVLGKQYNDVASYEKAVAESNKKLEALYMSLKLDNDAAWMINTTVPAALDLTEQEVKNITKIGNTYQKMWEGATIDLRDMALKEDEPARVAAYKHWASDISSKCSSGFKKVINSPVTKIAVVGAAIAGAGALAYNKSPKAKELMDKGARKARQTAGGVISDATVPVRNLKGRLTNYDKKYDKLAQQLSGKAPDTKAPKPQKISTRRLKKTLAEDDARRTSALQDIAGKLAEPTELKL